MSGTRKSGSPSPKGRPQRKKPKKRNWRKIIQRLLILCIVGFLVLCAIFYFAYRSTTIPTPNEAYQAQSTYVYYSNGKAQLGTFATQNRDIVPLADVAQPMQDAVVAAEDRTFWTNHGIDPKGILRAAFSDATGGGQLQGASTITQQYVKLLYLTQQRTLTRKIKEAFLSLKIQQQESKQQILAGYLNTVYFGHGTYGVQAASELYFGESAKQLRPGQSAMLASIINSPNYLDPYGDKDQRKSLLGRYRYVINGMAEMGTLDSAKAHRLSRKLPKVKPLETDNQYGGQRGFMLTMVKKQLEDIGFSEQQIDSAGLRVTTTLQRGAMKAAKNGVLSQKPKGLKELHASAASVDVHSGALLGFYAGQGFLKSQFNWAMAGDSPGSAFKPFALAAGLKAGYSLKDTFDGNSPYTFPNGDTVQNEGGNDYGSSVSLLKGLEESINTVYIDLTMSIPDGAEKIKKTAIDMGVPKDTPGLDASSTIALGSASVSPVNMANAYATIANHGVEHDWHLINKVTDSSGKVLWRHHDKTHRAIGKDIAADVSYAMQQVALTGTGSANASPSDLGRPDAGKTGTATNQDNQVITSWYVGFTPQVSTAVMYVRGKGRKSLEGYLNPFFGASYPASTWTAIMRPLMAPYPVEQFPPPAFVDKVAPESGHAPYTPPPPPPTTHKAKPTKKPSPTKTPSPTRTPSPSPSTEPSPTGSPTPQCPPVGCIPQSPSPSSSPSPTNGNGNGGGGGGKKSKGQ